eukprot:365824-Chlamydomonas_euryale.AAC.12
MREGGTVETVCCGRKEAAVRGGGGEETVGAACHGREEAAGRGGERGRSSRDFLLRSKGGGGSGRRGRGNSRGCLP